MISCEFAHLIMHIQSRAYMHITPIMHNSSRSKHNAYMLALYSRDAYDYTARRDPIDHRRDRLHMTYHSRDKTPLFSSRFACPYYSRDSYKCQL